MYSGGEPSRVASFRLLVRCFVFLQILAAICGTQGLSNPDVTLRTRSCYFLTKLVKAMRDGVVQYVDVIVPGVQGEQRKRRWSYERVGSCREKAMHTCIRGKREAGGSRWCVLFSRFR